MMQRAKIIFVGGFLGAGKTTLLWEAARRWMERGKCVGLITNDQAPELVDTAYLGTAGVQVQEVSGSCFCCNFDGMLRAAEALKDSGADLILAEPVGSCTDLSATILQPVKQRCRETLEVAPLTVLVDTDKLAVLLDGRDSGLEESALYILRKQLEEADVILINKTELLLPEAVGTLEARCLRQWPLAHVMAISAKTGARLEEWMALSEQAGEAGTHIAQVDYDIYARGEAVLGWLNMKALLKCEAPDWNVFAERLLAGLATRFDAMELPVGHVKLWLSSERNHLAGNITGRAQTLELRGDAGTATEAQLILNARVQTSPETLKAIVLDAVLKACGGSVCFQPVAVNCLSPGRPSPSYRYADVVG